jgi:hypothetical protein
MSEVMSKATKKVSTVKRENPYRAGMYHDVFAYWKQKQIVTRSEYVKFVMEKLSKTETAANAVVTVMLSPRKASKRGDARGNISSAGHLYFAEKLGRSVKGGIKDEQKFRLRWREVALEPRTRNEKIETVGEKVAKEVVVPVAPIVPAVIE